MEKKNILLILTDQQRSDINGFNGGKICKTPNLDQLAKDGVNFTRAYSHCPLCTPTRASIYSGRAIHNHGIMRNVEDNTPNAPSIGTKEIPSLAQYLASAGYKSAFIGKWHAGKRLPGECGFDAMDISGYGDILNSSHYLNYLKKKGLKKPKATPVGVGYPHNLLLAGKMSGSVEASVPYFLAESTIEKIKEYSEDDAPYFLALNFWGPHAPYLPCEPYASMYNPKELPPWSNYIDNFENKPPLYKRHHDSFVGEGATMRSWDECAQWVALYFGFMTQIDAQIGRVLGVLKKLGIEDQTAVFFSTDHGDLCGAHNGMHDKNALMIEELMHIPMLAKIPGITMQGEQIEHFVSNLDLPATITDIAGLGVPEIFDGRSLLPLFSKKTPFEWPDYLVSECFGVHFAYETRMVVYKHYKYIFHPGAFDELYNLDEDPDEMFNLIQSEEYKNILDECRIRLLQWMRDTKDPFQRAFFLFEKHELYSPETVKEYSLKAAESFFSRPPQLR